MTLIETFRHIEKRIGVFYASSFYEFIEKFLRIISDAKFKAPFPKFHFCTEEEIRHAIDNFIPEEFIPFFVEEQNGYEDYYCFDKQNSENKNRVVVFSQDAIVFEWENYNTLLMWIAKHKSLSTK